MKIMLADTEDDIRLWEGFVDHHAFSSYCHRWGWKGVIENSFKWETFYLSAVEDGKVHGILPLVWQKSWLFGSFLTSLPFLNAGGMLADSPEVQQALLQEAVSLAKRLRARHLELRHRRELALGLPTKTTKVSPVRPVGPDSEKMWQKLNHKLRTDIRKGIKSNLTATFGGDELLNDFYEIFAENMRELGTPVYDRTFFQEIRRTFPKDTYIGLVRHEAAPVAGSFLVGYRDTLEAVWSASRYRYLNLRPNAFLYWKILCFAGEKGYRIFDFGRSTVGSGTHRFKQQWGTEDVQLHWDYWLRDGTHLPELNPENPRYKLALSLWRKVPLAITKLIGPRIVRCLP